MKTIYDTETANELIARISALQPTDEANWGKMNVFQMVKHCTRCDEMFLGKIKIKRVFIGRIIGKMILKKALQDGRPFGKNSPTSAILVTTNDQGDLETQKELWIDGVKAYAHFNNPDFVHPFFGPMTPQQVGIFAYKHADHHLRQFGA